MEESRRPSHGLKLSPTKTPGITAGLELVRFGPATGARLGAGLFWAGGLGSTEIGKRLGTNRALADHIATHCSRYDSLKPGDRRNVVGGKASPRQVVRVGSGTCAHAYPSGKGLSAMEITGTFGINVAQGPFEVFTLRLQYRGFIRFVTELLISAIETMAGVALPACGRSSASQRLRL